MIYLWLFVRSPHIPRSFNERQMCRIRKEFICIFKTWNISSSQEVAFSITNYYITNIWKSICTTAIRHLYYGDATTYTYDVHKFFAIAYWRRHFILQIGWFPQFRRKAPAAKRSRKVGMTCGLHSRANYESNAPNIWPSYFAMARMKKFRAHRWFIEF